MHNFIGIDMFLMIFETSYFKVVVAHNREAELKSQDLVKTMVHI